MPNDQLPPAVEQGFDDRYICKEHPREPKHYVDLEPEDVKQFLAQAIATQERELLEWVRTKVIGEDEKIGLPTTQKAEQTAWEKKQRNKLRAAQRRELGERE